MSHRNSEIWPLPDWLPTAVGQFVYQYAQAAQTAQFEVATYGGTSTEVQVAGTIDAQIWHISALRERLRRLTTDSRMRSPWKYLNSVEFAPLTQTGSGVQWSRDDFLRIYLSMALAWTAPPVQMLDGASRPSKRAKALKKAAMYASKLRELLGDPSNFGTYTLWNSLDAAMESLRVPGERQPQEVSTALAQLIWTFIGKTFNTYSPWILARPFFFCFPAQLDLLVFLASKVPDADSHPQRKRVPGAWNAWYIQRLASYVRSNLVQPLDHAIATTATVALEPKKKITRQYVEQLMKRYAGSRMSARNEKIQN